MDNRALIESLVKSNLKARALGDHPDG